MRRSAARHEEARRDGDLLVLGVAVDADDLEAVVESLGDLLGDVRRGDEEHLGEVDLEVEVVVAEGRVLRRVEDLEQRGRRIAAPVGAELVDLVEQDHRVHGAGVAQGAHEAARECADVGAPVTADLGLVADAAEAHAHELAVQRARDRLAQRRLADAGRPDEAEDGSAALVLDLALAPEAAHRQVLEDAVLDLFQTGVVGLEHCARGGHVVLILGLLAPWQGQQPVEVGADGGGLGMARAGAVEALELALGLLASLVRERSLGDALAVALGVVGTVLVAQLLADGVELATQHVLALRLVHVLRDVVADLPPELDLGQRVTRPREGALEPQLDVERLEQLDLALQRQVRRVARRVRQRAGVLDRAQERDDAAGTARLEDLLDHDAVLACELVCVLADLVGVGVLGHGDAQCTADALALTLAELGAVQGADGGAVDGRPAASPAGRRARRPRRSARTGRCGGWR